jgi:hypothetical protein
LRVTFEQPPLPRKPGEEDEEEESGDKRSADASGAAEEPACVSSYAQDRLTVFQKNSLAFLQRQLSREQANEADAAGVTTRPGLCARLCALHKYFCGESPLSVEGDEAESEQVEDAITRFLEKSLGARELVEEVKRRRKEKEKDRHADGAETLGWLVEVLCKDPSALDKLAEETFSPAECALFVQTGNPECEMALERLLRDNDLFVRELCSTWGTRPAAWVANLQSCLPGRFSLKERDIKIAVSIAELLEDDARAIDDLLIRLASLLPLASEEVVRQIAGARGDFDTYFQIRNICSAAAESEWSEQLGFALEDEMRCVASRSMLEHDVPALLARVKELRIAREVAAKKAERLKAQTQLPKKSAHGETASGENDTPVTEEQATPEAPRPAPVVFALADITTRLSFLIGYLRRVFNEDSTLFSSFLDKEQGATVLEAAKVLRKSFPELQNRQALRAALNAFKVKEATCSNVQAALAIVEPDLGEQHRVFLARQIDEREASSNRGAFTYPV